MKARTARLASAMFLAGLYSLGAQAFTFEGESVKGSFDSTVTFGFGKRLKNQSCSLVGDVTGPCGASADYAIWSNGDDGNMNYNKGDFFTTYLKGNHELLLKLPSEITFMARANWMHDFAADKTRRTELLGDAKQQMTSDVNLMDLWISKEFNIGDQRARVRVGNQVVSWGESLFAPGGINSTNAMDINRLSSPGMQLKEVFLPAPIISFATGLGNGLNVEGYYQTRWNRSKLPAVGSYWSVADFAGKGSHKQLYLDATGLLNGIDAPTYARLNGVSLDVAEAQLAANLGTLIGGGGPPFPGVPPSDFAFALPQTTDLTPKNSGQYGLSLRWTPKDTDLNLGFYYMNYHDKTPNGRWWIDVTAPDGGSVQNVFLENRKMYGVSVNTSIGNWAIGAELSYRPKDAVSLSACSNTGTGGTADNFAAGLQGPGAYNCDGWMDMKKYQTHLTGILALTPGDHGWFLDAVGAQTGYFLGEFVWTHYPEADPNKVYTRTVNGVAIDQVLAGGLYSWPADGNKNSVRGTGTKNSYGYMFDFSLVYDSTLISGWQVIPGIFMMGALKGETPNLVAFWQEGAKSANFYVNFVQNPAKWQAGVNYTTFWGGKSEYHQVLKDRDFVGGYVSYNF